MDDPDRLPWWLLSLTAVLCGAIVMAVEILGARVIGPFFGVSLFVWTSVISVTLLALASGYAAGGALADRRPWPGTLYGLLFLTGCLLAALPLLKAPVLRSCQTLGIAGGAFASAAVLFGAPLFLLGAVSPYLVRLGVRELAKLGRTAGWLSALSTGGSFLGTVITGFLLVGWLPVTRILQLLGASLLGLSGAYFLLCQRRRLPLFGLLLPFLLIRPSPLLSKVQPNGTTVTELFRKESFYGTLQVLEYSYGEARTRELCIDGLVQGGIDVATGLPIYEFAYFTSFVPYALREDGKSCLVVGLGAGIVPRFFAERGARVDVVDIDPTVISVAERYFGFRPKGDVFIADARRHLASSPRRYDWLILDVFTGDTTPSHILGLEALSLCKERLEPGGILACNLMAAPHRRPFVTASIARTLERLFATVEIHPTFDAEGPRGYGNLTLVAHDGPARPLPVERVSGFPVHPMARDAVRRFLGRPYPTPRGGIVLTDDHNPIDVRDLWLKQAVRRDVIEGTDWDVLVR